MIPTVLITGLTGAVGGVGALGSSGFSPGFLGKPRLELIANQYTVGAPSAFAPSAVNTK